MADVPREGREGPGEPPVRPGAHDAEVAGTLIEVVPNGAWAVRVLLCATFPAVEEQVRGARRAVRRVLGAHPEFDAGDAELLVSELAGNAVRHSGSRVFTVELACTWSGALRIVLVDEGRGSTTPHLRAGGPSDLGGRGLRLVNELAGRWGVVRERGGRLAVWCELGGGPQPYARPGLRGGRRLARRVRDGDPGFPKVGYGLVAGRW
ncbi:Anti-sigma regulatory factor (Ser/Thr protein kinase) [Thermomonospora echinospora]|uniref:Anti-sigma regulatory factor (Ser/Thr protein kinase) n=1 Tax=Thermomonospora echinospora TaxID=1992 RepID=A0A1H6E0P6_9ACTN|nr:ATP-binding protein [Thermomonospora echinospora]SEG91170.1 Anti-sigma regulatory factor (Ser/Thr protein kinase) [Thermomonospora echinospora]